MLEVLKYTLPALIVLLAAWIVMAKQMKNEAERRLFELKKQSQSVISPIRMRGYERLALLLERITPEHLLLNVDMNNMSVDELHRHLLQTIRLEYDHNLSQQIYVSDSVWDAIVLAKNETMNFINAMSAQLPANTTTLSYAQLLITAYNTNGETPTQRAISMLKAEARQLL